MLDDSSGLAQRRGAVAQRRAGGTDVVEQTSRRLPGDARGVAGEAAACGKPLRARPPALRVAGALLERRRTPAPAMAAARRATSATPSMPRTRRRLAVVGTGTSSAPRSQRAAQCAAPSASATSRRPSLSAQHRRAQAVLVRPERRHGQPRQPDANRLRPCGAQLSHKPEPSALQLAHCGGKSKSSSARHSMPLDHDRAVALSSGYEDVCTSAARVESCAREHGVAVSFLDRCIARCRGRSMKMLSGRPLYVERRRKLTAIDGDSASPRQACSVKLFTWLARFLLVH